MARSASPAARHRLMTSCALGLALVALGHAPEARAQQAFQGDGVVAGGSATITQGSSANTDTITVNSDSAVINWSTDDAATTGGPINFLPNGATARFQRTGAGFTVLNRILPSGARPIALNGTVESSIFVPGVGNLPGGNVWFYSPNGVIAGATSVFSVGGLVLTANDIPFTTGPSGGIAFGPSGEIRFGQGSNPTVAGAAVEIAAGAQINALLAGSYVVAVAPRVVSRGSVTSSGSVGFLAAEQVDVTINNGLYDINFITGTTQASAIDVAGSVSAPAPTGAGDIQRVFIGAMPRNTAITMLVGGTIGSSATGVAVDNGTIVLTGGYDVASGAITGAAQGTGSADLVIGTNSNFPDFLSDVVARTSGALTASPSAANRSITFRGDATLRGDVSANVAANTSESIFALGDLSVSSSAAATVLAERTEFGYGSFAGAITVQGGLTVDASNSGAIDFTPTGIGGDATGGTASALVNGGTLQVAGATIVRADGIGGYGGATSGRGTGGTASLSVERGGAASLAGLTVSADGRVSGPGNFAPSLNGGDAIGGTATLSVAGASTLTAGATTVTASATGSAGSIVGTGNTGGDATGGRARLIGGGATTLGTTSVLAQAIAGSARGAGGVGGAALATTFTSAQIAAGAGTTTLAAANVSASVIGGAGGAGGTDGAADARNARAEVISSSGAAQLNVNSSLTVSAGAVGQAASIASGPIAAGTAAVRLTDGARLIVSGPIFASANAQGVLASGGAPIVAAQATGGTVTVGEIDSTLTANAVNLSAFAAGGNASSTGGAATGGTTTLFSRRTNFAEETLTTGASSANTINVSAQGGAGADGAAAIAGSATIEATGGRIIMPGSTDINANATGGAAAAGGVSGAATGGAITILAQAQGGVAPLIQFGSITGTANGFGSTVANGSGGTGRGGSSSVAISAGTVTGSALNFTANGRGGIAAAAGTAATPFVAGAGFGGTHTVAISGGATTIGSIGLVAAGTGGAAAATSSGAPIAGVAGDGTGGTNSLTITGGAFNAGNLAATASGVGGAGASGPATSAGGRGRGGSSTGVIDGAGVVFSPGILSLIALGSGGTGGTSQSSATGGAGGIGQGGVATLTHSNGNFTSPITVLITTGRGGSGGANRANGDAGAGGAGLGGRTAFNVSAAYALDALELDSSALGGFGGLAGQESGYGVIYGSGSGGSGGGAIGGEAEAEFAVEGDLESLFVNINGAGGAGGGGGRGGAGGNGSVDDEGLGAALLFTASTSIGEANVNAVGLGGDGGLGAFGPGGRGGDGTGGAGSLTISGDTVALSIESETGYGSFFSSRGAGGVAGASGTQLSPGAIANGADGGNGAGGDFTISIDDEATIRSSAVDFILTGSGGAGSAAFGAGAGGSGGDGTGGAFAVTAVGGAALTSLGAEQPLDWSIDVRGSGATGRNGGASTSAAGGRGGDGGDGISGAISFTASGDDTNVDFANLEFLLDGSAGTGGDGGSGGTIGGAGGAGGRGVAGGVAINLTGAAAARFSSIAHQSRGTGGAGGAGANGAQGGGAGGRGGDGLGGSFAISLTDADLEPTNLSLLSTGTGGAGGRGGSSSANGTPGGAGGRGGDGFGGGLSFTATDANFEFESIALTTSGVGGTGGDSGLGTGVPGIPGSPAVPGTPTTPPVPAVPPVPPVPPVDGAVGLGGEGTAGDVSIVNADNGAPGTFVRDFGAVTLTAGAEGGLSGDPGPSGFFTQAQAFGARVEFRDDATAEGGDARFDSLDVIGAGNTFSGDEGFFFESVGGPVRVSGNVVIDVPGAASFTVTGAAGLVVDGSLSVRADERIEVNHVDQAEVAADTILAENAFFDTFGGFVARPGSVVRARDNLSVRAFGFVEADDLRAVNRVAVVSELGGITLRDATVTGAVSAPFGDGRPNGGAIELSAGISEGFISATDITITGTVNATGTVDVQSGGDIRVIDGASVLSDNRIEFASGDDILIESGATVRAAVDPLPEFGYGSSGDPLGTPAQLVLDAGGFLSLSGPQPIGSVIVDGTLSAIGRPISIIGDAIQADDASIESRSLYATVRDAPPLGVLGSNDGGQLRLDCIEGNICLGDLTNLTGVLSVGPANRISIASTDVQVEVIDIVARDELVIGREGVSGIFSGSDSVSLEATIGDVEVIGTTVTGGELAITAGGSLLGSGAFSTADDIGITVGGSVGAASIDAGRELTSVEGRGGELEGQFSVPGSFVVGTVTIGGTVLNLGAGGDIDIGVANVNGNLDLDAGGNAFLGTASGASSINIEAGLAVGFDQLDASTISLSALGGGINGGSASASGDLNLNAAGPIDFDSLTGSRVLISGDGAVIGDSVAARFLVEIDVDGDVTIETARAGLAGDNGAAEGLLDLQIDAGGAIDLGLAESEDSVLLTAGAGVRVDTGSAGNNFVVNAGGDVGLGEIATLGLDDFGYGGAGYGDTADIGVITSGAVSFDTLNSADNIAIDAGGAVTGGDASADLNLTITAGSVDVGALIAGDGGTPGSIDVNAFEGAVEVGSGDATVSIEINAVEDAVTTGALDAGADVRLRGATGVSFSRIDAGDDAIVRGGGINEGGGVILGDVTGGAIRTQGFVFVAATGSVDVDAITSALDYVTVEAVDDVAVGAISAGYDITVEAGDDIAVGSALTTDAGEAASVNTANIVMTAGGDLQLESGDSAENITLDAGGAVSGQTLVANRLVTVTGGSVNYTGLLRAGRDNAPADLRVTAETGALAIGAGRATRDVRLTSLAGGITSGAIDAQSGSAALFAATDVALTAVDAGGVIFVGNASQLAALGGNPTAFQLSFATPVRIGGRLTATGDLVSRGGPTAGGVRLGAAGGFSLRDVTAGPANILLTGGGASTASDIVAQFGVTGIFDNGLVADSISAPQGRVTLSSTNGGFRVGSGQSLFTYEVDALGDVVFEQITVSGSEGGYGATPLNIDIETDGAIALGAGRANGSILLDAGAAATGGALTARRDVRVAAGSIAFTGNLIAGGPPIGGGTPTPPAVPADVSLTARTGGIDVARAEASRDVLFTGAGAARFTGVDAARDFVGEAAALTVDEAEAARIRLTATTGASSLGTLRSGSTIELTGAGAITANELTAATTATLASSGGAVRVSDLRAGGAVDARGASLQIGSGGGALSFANAVATSGAIDIEATGALSVAAADATGAIALESDGDVTLDTGRAGGGIEIDAGRNATLGAVTAGGLLDVAAPGLATINGAATGPRILIESGDIAIGSAGRLGGASTTELSLRDTDANRPTFIGGTGSTTGYSLSADEMLRLFADNILIFGGRTSGQGGLQVGSARAPDVVVGAFTLSGRGTASTGQLGSGRLRIETPGKLRVNGAVSLTGLSSANRFELQAFEALEVIGGQGSIDMRGSGTVLGGTLFLGSEDVIVASTQAIIDVAAASTTDAIDDRLARRDGDANDEGALRANGIQLSVSRGVFVQNTGAGDDFDERRGLTVGSGGLSISTSPSIPGRIVINGRQFDPSATPTTGVTGGFITGVDFLRRVTINGSGGSGTSTPRDPSSPTSQTGAALDPLSTINGCLIANPSGCLGFEPTFPPERDVIEEFVGEFDEGALSGSDLPTTLIEIREFEPFGYEPLIDEPVTGAGNDDLYIRDCAPGSEDADCAAPPAEGSDPPQP